MKGCGKIILYGIGGIIVLIFVAVIGSMVMNVGSSDSNSSSRQQVATSGPTSTPTPEWMAPSFDEMCDNNDTMTDLQQEDYAASMADKKIVGWVGKVYDVQSDSGDTYTVQVDMNADGIFKARQVEILNIPRDLAASLNVDQEIGFDGTIKSVEMFASDICNPINVISATITPQ